MLREMLLSFIDSEQFIVVTADTLNIDGRIVGWVRRFRMLLKMIRNTRCRCRGGRGRNLVLHQIAVARDDEKCMTAICRTRCATSLFRRLKCLAFLIVGEIIMFTDATAPRRRTPSTPVWVQNAAQHLPAKIDSQYAVTMNINESYIKNNLRPALDFLERPCDDVYRR